jgi:hypothetical protein
MIFFFGGCLKFAEGVTKSMVGCTLKVLHSHPVINQYIFCDSTAVVKTNMFRKFITINK